MNTCCTGIASSPMSFFYGPSPQYKQETQACIHHAARGILVVLPTQHHNVVNYSKEGILAGSYSCALMPRRNAFVLWIQRCCPHQQWQRIERVSFELHI